MAAGNRASRHGHFRPCSEHCDGRPAELPNKQLKDNGGSGYLPYGTAAAGDGAILQLGYYNNGSSANPFSGTSVTLTGTTGANSDFANTTIGDSGGGANDGRFRFANTFIQASPTSGASLPPVGTPLVIRFYNKATLDTATLYNEVSSTSTNWQWKAPAEAPGALITLSLSDSALVWGDGPSSAFATYIPTTVYKGSILTLTDTSANPRQTADLPIILNAHGTENAVKFSLSFDSSQLSYVSTTLGTDATGAALIINSNGTTTGQVGIALSLSSNQTFVAGQRQIAVVHFTLATGLLGGSAPVSFTNTPVAEAVSSANATTLDASFVSISVNILGGYEADVSPRPSGSGQVTVTDWTQVGRFVAGLDTPTGTEFQRADCAPRLALGDGKLTVTDWTQAGRYAAELDSLTATGGSINATQGTAMLMTQSLTRSVKKSSIQKGLIHLTQGDPTCG
jgi:hypothetical protein